MPTWLFVIIAKWVLGVLMVAGLAYAYDSRDYIIDAYEVEQAEAVVVEDRPVADISDYIDLSKIRTLDYEAADFAAQDTRRVALPIPTAGAVPTTEPSVQGGTGVISGRVTFNGEPVDGADVTVERIIGDVSSSITVRADGNGAFRAPRLLGGRYRIRAFQPPNLSMRNAEVLFLPENGKATELELSLSNESSSNFSGRFSSDVARVGTNYTVTVEFRNASVNAEGIIEDGPVPNELVAITVRDPLMVNGSILKTSNANGIAQFTVRCSEEGNGRITITSRNRDQNVPVPPCTLQPRPTPQTVPVGESFSQPNQSIAPRGTYQGRPAANQPTNNNNGNSGNNANNNNGNGATSTTAATSTTGASTTSSNPASTAAQQSTTTASTTSQSPTSANSAPSSTNARTVETRGFRSFGFQTNLSSVFAGSAVCSLEYQLWNGEQWGPVFNHGGGTPIVFGQIARILPSDGIPCEYVRVA